MEPRVTPAGGDATHCIDRPRKRSEAFSSQRRSRDDGRGRIDRKIAKFLFYQKRNDVFARG
jgi:hypothetical protein